MRLRRAISAVLVAAVVLAVPVAASAADARPGRLQPALDAVVAAGAPGAVLEYRENGRVERDVSGVAELGRDRPVPRDGRFRVGSVTKTFTSTVALQLVGEGRLRLDDTVERWLPGRVPNGGGITVRQLLNHTSGIFNYTDVLFTTPEALLADRYKRWTPDQLVDLAVAQPPNFPPGTSWAYSNTNYVLAGMIIEKVTGRSWGSEVQRRIIGPVGLHDTSVPGNLPFVTGPHAHGYIEVDGQAVDITTWNPSAAYAAGEVISTTEDLNRFYAAVLTGRLLKPAQLAEMKTTVPGGLTYGLGIYQQPLPCGITLWGHTGGIPGYSTYSFQTEDGSKRLTLSETVYKGDTSGAVINLFVTAFCPAGTSGGASLKAL
ncbi:serine hydrolase domain-containing protein [Longispora sp. K20-0274]|uniref:serine hydrolase domain-containing protein n=1 Tax=Longispora sp. K20-0274 TaxID=3088255 RepID=UPI003999DE13